MPARLVHPGGSPHLARGWHLESQGGRGWRQGLYTSVAGVHLAGTICAVEIS